MAADDGSKGEKAGIPDPFAAFRQLLDSGERILNQALADQSASEQAKASRARSANAALDMQNVVQNLRERYYEGIDVASRTEMRRLGERITNLEDGITRIEKRLDALERKGTDANADESAPRRTKARPKRTRKPPAKSTKQAK